MKILSVNDYFVEVLWIDDNEIEYIPREEFDKKYGTPTDPSISILFIK